MPKKIIAIILAYNCENEIIKSLKKIHRFEKYFFKICVVDNNSKDKHLKELIILLDQEI